MMSKVFILGGTGFLGYYTTKELLSRGYQVKTISLPPLPAKDLFPEEVEIELGNINEKSDEEIIDLLSDCSAFIYGAGADERMVPKKPALKYFYDENVLPTQRLARLAREAGVKKFVIFGSYFSEFAERLDGKYDLKNQPYPNTRLMQEQIAFAEGEGAMDVMSLRLPYIFGTMPGRTPLWKMFTDQIKGRPVFPSLKGGTAMVTAQQVAEAAVGAIEKGKHRKTYAISALNMKYNDFYKMMVEALGQTETTQVPVLPFEHLRETYEQVDRAADEQGVEHGIRYSLTGQLQEEDKYIDPAETMSELGIKEYDVVESIRETLAKCVAE